MKKIKFLHLHNWNSLLSLAKVRNNLDWHELEKTLLDNETYHGTFLTNYLDNYNYETKNFIINCDDVSKKWAKEKKIDFENSKLITTFRIIEYNPEIIYFQDPTCLGLDNLKQLRSKLGKNKFFIASCGFPVKEEYYNLFDLVIFRSKNIYNKMQKLKTNFNYCFHYHSFNLNVLKNLKLIKFNNKKIYSSFVGSSLGMNHNSHKKRYLYLNGLCTKRLSEIYLDENHLPVNKKLKPAYFFNVLPKNLKNLLINFYNSNLFRNLKNHEYYFNKLTNLLENNYDDLSKFVYLGPLKKIHKNIQSAKFGIDMYEILNQSKISINIHADTEMDTVANIRMFEATGMNSCLFVEKAKNLEELFDTNKEVVTYESFEELESKLLYYKNNINNIQKISQAGHQKTINLHNSDRFSEFVNNKIKSNFI